jgi:hypothetical protein
MNVLEMPLEAFSKDMVEEAIECESQLMVKIESIDAEIEALQVRLLGNKDQLNQLDGMKREIGQLRHERALLAGKGEDSSRLSELIAEKQQDIRAAESQVEFLEDEKKGIMDAMVERKGTRQNTVNLLAEQQDKTKIIQYCVAAKEYNHHANILAETVEKLWECRANLPHPYDTMDKGPLPHPKGIWYDTALWRIPRLCKEWSEDSMQQAFFFTRHK